MKRPPARRREGYSLFPLLIVGVAVLIFLIWYGACALIDAGRQEAIRALVDCAYHKVDAGTCAAAHGWLSASYN